MRIGILSLTVLAAVAFAVATSPSASAQTATVYPWCVLQSGPCSSDCSYATIEQCRATASGGVGFLLSEPGFHGGITGQSRSGCDAEPQLHTTIRLSCSSFPSKFWFRS